MKEYAMLSTTHPKPRGLFRGGSMMSGRIRLGCISCSRDDFDGIDKLPDDWEDIDEVQSYEDSLREVHPDDDDGDIMFWETHLGVCPDCHARIARVALERIVCHATEADVSGSSVTSQ